MTATVKRYSAPSGNRDADYFYAECTPCQWKGGMHSNRTVEGRTLAERDAAQHRCKNPAAVRFLIQNDTAACDLTDEDRETVEAYAEHHAGGLYVLGREVRPAPDRVYVKMHDDWGDGEQVVVHTYNPDYDGDAPDGDPVERVEFFDSGHAALARFLTVGDEPDAARIVEQLRLRDVNAHVNGDLGPTEVEVYLTGGTLNACRHFNREDGGWEAMIDRDGTPEECPDGPPADASVGAVVTWLYSLLP